MQWWESVFLGGLWFLGNPKDSVIWFAKHKDIPRQSKISQKVSALFEFMFDLIGFAYVLSFLNDFDISKIHQDSTTDKIFENARRSHVFYTHHILNKNKN